MLKRGSSNPHLKTQALTKKQRRAFDAIYDFWEEHGYMPTYVELGDILGVSSKSTVHNLISFLKEKGYLKNQRGELEFTAVKKTFNEEIGKSEYIKLLELPLVGLITAGEPIEAVEEKETIAVPTSLASDDINHYVLKVKGDSMIEDGILDGDYVIVERDPSPLDGDVVVALLDNAYATLKKFYREANRIRLQPANRTMKPIYAQDPLIQGIVRGIIRKFA